MGRFLEQLMTGALRIHQIWVENHLHFANIRFILSIAGATVWNENELSCCTAVSFLYWNDENIFKTSLLVLSSLLLASIRLMFVDSPLATIDKTQLNTYMHTHIYIYTHVWMRIYCVIHDHVFCLHLSHLVGGFNPSTQPMQIIASTNHGYLSVWANESPLTNSLMMVLYACYLPSGKQT